MCRRKALPTSSPRPSDPSVLAALGQARKDLATERNRRARAEALVNRAKGGGIRPGDFPSVRDVQQGVDQLADDALTWTEKACSIGGSDVALPLTLQSILESTFVVCRGEVELCLERRLQSLSEFLGNQEPVLLSGGDSMNLDTQYVLYECLCRNYESIVPMGPDDMSRLARAIVESCRGPRDLAESIISGDAWFSFEDLMENYMMVFVEMALQKPRMEFEDDLGKQVAFAPVTYRDWAPYCKAAGSCFRDCVHKRAAQNQMRRLALYVPPPSGRLMASIGSHLLGRDCAPRMNVCLHDDVALDLWY
ncbi:unnamed protein product [Scytosiphon promiscuus]